MLEQVASVKGPCRVSLKPFNTGEDTRLIFSHSPFDINNAFNQSGLIFINKKEVEAYNDVYKFPMEIKAGRKNSPIFLIGYSYDQKMIYTKIVVMKILISKLQQFLIPQKILSFSMPEILKYAALKFIYKLVL